MIAKKADESARSGCASSGSTGTHVKKVNLVALGGNQQYSSSVDGMDQEQELEYCCCGRYLEGDALAKKLSLRGT